MAGEGSTRVERGSSVDWQIAENCICRGTLLRADKGSRLLCYLSCIADQQAKLTAACGWRVSPDLPQGIQGRFISSFFFLGPPFPSTQPFSANPSVLASEETERLVARGLEARGGFSKLGIVVFEALASVFGADWELR